MNTDWLGHARGALLIAPVNAQLAEARAAQQELAHMIAKYGPVEVARAARKGLESRNNGGPS